MSLFGRLLSKAAIGAVALVIDAGISHLRRAIKRQERKLEKRLAKILGQKSERLDVKLTLFPDGTTVAHVHLKWGVSQKDLSVVHNFLDEIGEVRQNVRTPLPAVN